MYIIIHIPLHQAIHEVQQKANFKNLLLEKKLQALNDTLEKKEAQLNEVLSASNLDPTALSVVTRKLEVSFQKRAANHPKRNLINLFTWRTSAYVVCQTVFGKRR